MARFQSSLACWVLLSVLAAAPACGTATFVVQQYEGEARPIETISILRINGGSRVAVVALDGESLGYSHEDATSRVHIEMLPGVHELDVGNLDDPTQRIVTLRLQAEPGKVYRLTVDNLQGNSLARQWRPLVWEVERDDDRALRTVAEPPAVASGAVPEDGGGSAQPPAPTVPAPTVPAPTAPAPTVPVPTVPVPTAPVPTGPVPTVPVPTVPVPPVPPPPAPSRPAPATSAPSAAAPPATLPPTTAPRAGAAPASAAP